MNTKYDDIPCYHLNEEYLTDALEIKTGSVWSTQRFLDRVQWKLYAAALPPYKEVDLVNCARRAAPRPCYTGIVTTSKAKAAYRALPRASGLPVSSSRMTP